MTKKNQTTPTNPMAQMFDREEMIRLSREGMENSLRFFATLNENILKLQEWQREQINDATRRQLETMNQAVEEYQKNTRIIMSRIETVCRQMVDQTTGKREQEQSA